MTNDEESEAIRKLEVSASKAQRRVLESADEARDIVRDACEVAIRELSKTAQASQDKRNLNGSYRWDRPDDKRLGKLEIGQAKREEQILGLLKECVELEKTNSELSVEVSELRGGMNTQEKEFTSRMTTQRELILSIKEEWAKDQKAMLWKIIGAVSAIAFLFLLVTITLATGTFGSLP